MSNKAKILILSGGFGGVYSALRLDKTLARRVDIEVTLVSRDNFLLFTPMLHEVASGDLNPSLGKTKPLFLRAVRGSAETGSHKTGLGASGRGNFSDRTRI